PRAARKRLVHGEWEPTSKAMRAPGYFCESRRRLSLWLVTLRSSMMVPAASRTQTACFLSPRSRPMVMDGMVVFMAAVVYSALQAETLTAFSSNLVLLLHFVGACRSRN